MSKTEGFWWCPIHGIVVSWPCPLCSRMTITESDLESHLDAHLRSIETRLNDQRSAVARLISEATQELRDEIEAMKARIADQDAEIAELHRDLKTQAVLERTTYQYATATEEQLSRLRRRFALNIDDLSLASSRQDEQIKALVAQIGNQGAEIASLISSNAVRLNEILYHGSEIRRLKTAIVTHLVEQP